MAGLPLYTATNIAGISYDALLYCKTNIGGFFFDGFIEVSYEHTLEVTSNPVETGAAVTDHAYVNPRKLQMRIRMSDVHQSLVAGQFEGGWSRSVKAWNVLDKMQTARIPVMVGTQLGMYPNMLITSLKADEDQETYRGLYATVELTEIPIARVKTVEISAASQTTIDTQMAQLQAVETNSLEDQSILYSMIGGELVSSGSSSFSNVSVGRVLGTIKSTCYCYNCNDNSAGTFGTTATSSGRVATVGETCAMKPVTLVRFGLKVGDYIAIEGLSESGIEVRRIDDIAGVKDVVDVYVTKTGSVSHCKCASNPYSGKQVQIYKVTSE